MRFLLSVAPAREHRPKQTCSVSSRDKFCSIGKEWAYGERRELMKRVMEGELTTGTQSKCLTPLMDIRNSIGVTSALLASRKEIGYLMEIGDLDDTEGEEE
ncbi:hypothetical protein EVAR_3485_1 [Eumeta japonica]|uniref:Uncharacterized protein n=1 Tax=Eumeta variegata TaxID=151549 RepID=A0A4C1SVC2_EUMVA|nr:hypothetical protein EVAR_3485_1 [Eumeta japonica]